MPIFHVNADDPEAVQRVFQLATQWRQQFRTDVVIDLIGYRKNGHNEIDEPTFTQPMMYAKVRTQPSVLTKYLETVAATARTNDRLAALDATVSSADSSGRSATRTGRSTLRARSLRRTRRRRTLPCRRLSRP